ncbi:TonB-dependent receptor plug domain-containing protein [Pseudoduganella namucuonensis]|uniref:Iron complex outermembrane recepter protein n=1 Tax=Pseudoduganella namucuonensis TaxID=1035707 RepID=A0A1I7LWW2_9BURK|nr:TonB-dependent receptor [Pseudoduganella namucuonensis]SFV14201.1 iron complex outermembrane recepter protein [Pseudoduganella namucuonensis]
MQIRLACTLAVSTLLALGPAGAATVADGDLADLSIEQLSNIVITSVSRQEERLGNAAASIYIISAGEIRRGGVRSLPEALRLAPNLQVARVDARNYAITARGFGTVFQNKLLVLIDGRTTYSPLFSGVYWDAHDLVMEDIERIEVISGPGATMWGVNAVNGVINVITKSAKDTAGALASVVAGANEKDGTARFGAGLPNGGHYRLYARYMQVDDTYTAAGVNTRFGMQRRQAGFRADTDLLDGGLTVSGDAYQGRMAQINTRDIVISGANLVGRYTRKLADDSDLRLQLVLDHTERNQPANFIDRLNTAELEAQHSVRLGARHAVVWGGGYRHSWDQVTSGGFAFLPSKLDMHWGNVFAQDEITLAEGVRATAGLKVESNSYTGAEYLPSLRLAWNPGPQRLVWASLARTVRAPSRIDRDLYAPAKPIMIAGKPYFLLGGGQDFVSEVANVAELGYRDQPTASLSYSATLFYGRYDKLRTQEPVPVFGFAHRNGGNAITRGLELWGRWQAGRDWRLSGGMVAQDIGFSVDQGSRDAAIGTAFGTNDPKLHWLLRSSYDFSDTQQLDATLRYNGKLPNPAVPSYYEMDLQWLWKPREHIELALIGQNLLHSKHPEFGGLLGRSVFERTALLKLTWRY